MSGEVQERAQVIGEASTYTDLITVLRDRKDGLGLSFHDLDWLMGREDRYGSKLLSPRPHKYLGARSMGPLLAALKVKLVVVANDKKPEGWK